MRLRIEYIRATAAANPGLAYEPQFSSTLVDSGDGSWLAAVGSESVTPIDANWERVVIEDEFGGGTHRFGRVKVTMTITN